MKNLMMVLALAAVVAIAGTTFADVNINVSGPVASTLVPGYDIFTLSVVNDEPYLGFIKIEGLVVQANTFTTEYPPPDYEPVEVVVPTVWNNPGPPNPKEIDTHLLVTTAGGVFLGTPVETNDKSLSAPYQIQGFTLGMGTFDMGGGIGYATPLAAGTPFMQVVQSQANHSLFRVTGYFAGSPNDVAWSVSLLPEPSAFLMLFAGGLCLLTMRFRKASLAAC